MWYEALPSLLLTGVFVCLPFASLPFIHKFAHHGNPYARLQNLMHERCQVLRDGRLSNVGDPYLMKGLENIPD